jgi:hypothetical protein
MWMSRIENAAKPILLPMILGQEVQLDPQAQHIVSTWAALKAMTFEFTSSPDRAPHFTAAERLTFSESVEAPSQVQVFLAGYVGPHAVWARGAHTFFAGASEHYPAYASTASFGALVFQVFSHRCPREIPAVRLTEDFGAAAVRVRPPSEGAVSWPPESVFDEHHLESFALRFSPRPLGVVSRSGA